MSYHVETYESEFALSKHNARAALAALNMIEGALPEHHPTEPTAILATVLGSLGWEADYNATGITHLWYDTSRSWNEDSEDGQDPPNVLALIAPYVQAGSFIALIGEEGDIWRYCFDGKVMTEERGVVTFEPVGTIEPTPIIREEE